MPYRGLLGPRPLTALFLLSLSVLALKEMRLGTAAFATHAPIEAVVNSLQFPDNGHRLNSRFTGISSIDFGLRYLVAAFLPGVAGWDKGFQLQQIYFLISFFTIISIWSVEAGRKNAGRLIRWTSVWAILYQTVGGAVIVPLYYVAFMRESSSAEDWSPNSRYTSMSYAKALLPSLVLGYLLPTILMFIPFQHPNLDVTQGIIAIWQITPLLVNLLIFIIERVLRAGAVELAPSTHSLVVTKYLNRIYLTCATVSAVTHIAIMSICLRSLDPQTSFRNAIFFVSVRDNMSMAEALHYIFQVDFWIIFTAALTGAYVTLLDLKQSKKIDLSMNKVAVAIVPAVTFLGPAATLAYIWHRREVIMSRKTKD